MLEFILFVLIGWQAFAPPPAGSKLATALLVTFIVLMVLWLAGVIGVMSGWQPHAGWLR